MKIGLNFFPVHMKFVLPLAKCADELGYESLWLGEHLAIPTKIDSPYPYGKGLGQLLHTTPLFDPLITLSYIAAHTQKLQLGTGIYLLQARHPVLAARLFATLDVLTGGRVLIGVGSGWLKEEFDAIDVPWAHRGTRMEEGVEIMRRLWTEELVSHEGRFYKFNEMGLMPKPVRCPIPIFIGGETPVALRRAVRCGDGWFGVYHTPETAAEFVTKLRDLREDDDRPFEISVGTQTVPTLDEVRRFRDLGIDRLLVLGKLLSGGEKTIDAVRDGVKRFAETVVHRAND